MTENLNQQNNQSKEQQENIEGNYHDDHLILTKELRLTSNTLDSDERRWQKRFGYVIARPHEYLIHIRNGKLQEKSSGQASRCFKWARDTVILVPTSRKQLIFEASQLTIDNLWVRMRGFVIYHISSPKIIYQHISFWNRSSGEMKLARIIGESCRSHTKWLVANMTLEDTSRKRKERIADILVKELQFVVNDEKLGVTIDTIDIQNVSIVDSDVFRAVQQPAKDKIIYNQKMSELQHKREFELQKIKQEQEINEKAKDKELEKINNDKQIKSQEISLENIQLEENKARQKNTTEHELNISKIKRDSEFEKKIETAKIDNKISEQELLSVRKRAEIERETLEQKELSDLERKWKVDLQNIKQTQEIQGRRKEIELQQIQHDLEIGAEKRNLENIQLEEKRKQDKILAEHKASLDEFNNNKKLEQKKETAKIESEIATIELEKSRKQSELELETLTQKTKIDNSFSSSALEKIYISEVLPEVASTITSSLKNANLTIYQTPNESGGTPVSIILNEALSLLQKKIKRLDESDKIDK